MTLTVTVDVAPTGGVPKSKVASSKQHEATPVVTVDGTAAVALTVGRALRRVLSICKIIYTRVYLDVHGRVPLPNTDYPPEVKP